MKITERELKIYDRLLATVSAFAIICGGIWTIANFISAKNKENELRQQEIRQAIYEDKKAIYYELADAESEIAACNTYDEVVVAQKHFRKLFVGRAHIIAQLDDDVKDQKNNFERKLEDYLNHKTTDVPFDWFGPSCLDFVAICREKLKIDSVYK